jgi:hypothetical protein
MRFGWREAPRELAPRFDDEHRVIVFLDIIGWRDLVQQLVADFRAMNAIGSQC